MSRLKLGLAGVFRPLFKGDKVGIYSASVDALSGLARVLDFEFWAVPRPASDLAEAEAAARELRNAKVDFVLIQLSSFCGGDALTPFLADPTPLGLWAVPEPRVSGPLPLNSLCGINLYASLLETRAKGRPFKWFYGMASDERFLSRFRVTFRALKAKKALAEARIGLIGSHAPGFDNLAVNKDELEKRLGVQVFEHQLAELLYYVKEVPEQSARALADEMRRQSVACTASDDHLLEVARFQITLNNMALRRGYDALAVRCWPEIPDKAGVMICAALGRLADSLPTACEGDALGAAAMVALKAMSGSAPLLADLSHVDEQDQSVLMWHCGNSPACWADENGMRLECHFNRDTMGTVRSMVFRAGPVTVFQLSANGSVAFTFEGSFLGPSKPSFDGSRGWLGQMTFNNLPITVQDLLNTIFTRRLPHHFPIGAGHLTEEVAELCAWLGLTRVGLVPYNNALQT